MRPLCGIFTLSYHRCPGQNHLDLFLQLAPHKPLVTYHIALRQKNEVEATRAQDHRCIYLNFQGEISGGRGRVKILKQGVFIAPAHLLEKSSQQKAKITCQKIEIFDITHSMWKRAKFTTDVDTIRLYEIIPQERSQPEPVPKEAEEEQAIPNPGEMLLESFLEEKKLQNRFSAQKTPPRIDASTLREIIRESAKPQEPAPAPAVPAAPAIVAPAAPAEGLPLPTGEKPAEYLEVPEMVLDADGKSEQGYKK